MPLNPPSYKGQDVWYSPSVYVNQVQVALWQPAVPQPSAITTIPVIPNPKVNYSAEQIAQISATASPQAVVNPNGTVSNTTTSVGQAPDPNALPGQQAAPTSSAPFTADPVAAGQGGYTVLLALLKKCASEAKNGSWNSDPSLPNIKDMLAVTGQSPSVVRTPDNHTAWCATFQAYILQKAGLPYKNGSAVNPRGDAYRGYGRYIDIKDYTQWRQGDIVVTPQRKDTPQKYHATFLWGLAPDNRFICLGGNQGDKVCATYWSPDPTPIFYIGRNWDIPSELDRSDLLKNFGKAPFGIP